MDDTQQCQISLHLQEMNISDITARCPQKLEKKYFVAKTSVDTAFSLRLVVEDNNNTDLWPSQIFQELRS